MCVFNIYKFKYIIEYKKNFLDKKKNFYYYTW